MLFSAREHLASHWLDLAEDRLRLDRLSRNSGDRLSSPAGFAHSSRDKKVARPILRCAAAHAGAASIAFGLPIAIEAAWCGLEHSQGELPWLPSAPSRSPAHEFAGEIVTLCLQAKNVRIVPETDRTSDNAPSHRVFVGRVEIGAAWPKRSNEGRDYLGLKLDDPSFTAPIYANLFDDEEGEGYSLIWSRSRKPQRRLSRTRPNTPLVERGV